MVGDKARANHAERDVAQPECIAFLNHYGYAEKHRDGVTATGSVRCPRCGGWHGASLVAIQHTEKGVADYLGSVRNANGPIAYAVEVKAGGLVFPMNWIEDEQWTWTDEWERRTGGTAWFWLMLGTHALNSVAPNSPPKTPHPFRRVTYLVPRRLMRSTYLEIMSITDGKQTTLPMNDKVERVRFGKAYKINVMYANMQFYNYRLEWMSKMGIWLPHSEHPFWKTYRIDYPAAEAVQYEQQSFI